MLPILIKLAPVALKVAKAVVVIAPHAIAMYQQMQANKPAPNTPALPKPAKAAYGRKYPNPFTKKATK